MSRCGAACGPFWWPVFSRRPFSTRLDHFTLVSYIHTSACSPSHTMQPSKDNIWSMLAKHWVNVKSAGIDWNITSDSDSKKYRARQILGADTVFNWVHVKVYITAQPIHARSFEHNMDNNNTSEPLLESCHWNEHLQKLVKLREKAFCRLRKIKLSEFYETRLS